jgi:hypothetical protein
MKNTTISKINEISNLLYSNNITHKISINKIYILFESNFVSVKMFLDFNRYEIFINTETTTIFEIMRFDKLLRVIKIEVQKLRNTETTTTFEIMKL